MVPEWSRATLRGDAKVLLWAGLFVLPVSNLTVPPQASLLLSDEEVGEDGRI